jgi:FMN-dependent oxidoreductase (nitrilotriacetate monooxygenase family)
VTKQLVLGAFEEFTPSFISNAWPHPLSDPADFASLGWWQRFARELEAGGFDFLFFADALGYPMSTGSDGESRIPDAVVREAVQFPVHDPLSLVPALAASVDRLGFVVTASTTSEQPYLLARRFATLDHLTKGRIGWNIVTSDNQQALVKLLGLGDVTPHDRRYDRADEFVDLALRLWEEGWQDGAVVADKSSRTFTDPAKVRRITHDGEFFQLDGLFPVTPSPQRTPTLFQAGTSPRGLDFASRVAEVVFIQERDLTRAAAVVRGIRDRAEARGRGRDGIKIVSSISVVSAASAAEAAELRASLTAAPSREAVAALFLGWSGLDLTGLDPETPIDGLTTEVGQTTLAAFQGAGKTVGQVLDELAAGIGGTKVTGSFDEAAAEIARIAEVTDVDGFLIEHSFGGLASYRDFMAEVMPRLRSRGLLPDAPRGGTLRERLTGRGARR